MKMVKSLLLGSAAALVASAGAQAADLPVKAKPVEYVKVCSVYGAGFYYVPGTDTCIKVGGFVRAEYGFNAQGSHTPYLNGAFARDNRQDTFYYNTRSRGVLSFDARSQTSYGTLRAYMRAGWEFNSNTVGYGIAGAGAVGSVLTGGGAVVQDTTYRGLTYYDRAFIQFAGMTVGKTQSFFDFYANALNFTTSVVGGSDTGHGINLLAYTAQFGGGFSGTLSLEDNTHRRTGLWDSSTDTLGVGAIPGAGVPVYGNYAAQRYPDIVGNLRVDQPWGSAQIMAALHDASGSCFGTFCNPGGVSTNAGNATGWAVGGGLMFNLPWAQGDQLWLQGTFARGAASYLGFNKFVANDVFAMYSNGGATTIAGGLGGVGIGSVGLAWGFDGIFQTGTGVALTEGWQFNAAAQHFWTPSLRTSVFGGVSSLRFPGAATTRFCTGAGAITGAPGAPLAAGGPGGATPAFLGGVCNPNFSVVQVGTRTIWSPVANLDIGVEVLYTRLDQNFVGNWLLGASGPRAAGVYTARDQDTWSGLLRFQRNFWP